MTEHYTDEGHLLIRNSDIKDGYFEFGENPIYLDEEFSEQNKSRMHQLGDVITVHTGDIGTSAVIGENEVNSIGFATIVTRPNQEVLDSNYFATYLNTNTHKQWAISMATGDGRSNYNLKDYTNLVIPIPQIEEQIKIAACISNLNNLITLHQRKSFSKNCKKIVWEQRKLEDYIVEYHEVTTENNQYPALTSSRKGIFLQTEYFAGNQIASEDNTGYNVVPYGYFTYRHMSDDEIFHFNINDIVENGIVSTLYPVFTTTNKLDSRYLQYQLNHGHEFARFAVLQKQGGSRTYMYISKLKQLSLTMPKSVDEQKQISGFFMKLDHLITLHRRAYHHKKRRTYK